MIVTDAAIHTFSLGMFYASLLAWASCKRQEGRLHRRARVGPVSPWEVRTLMWRQGLTKIVGFLCLLPSALPLFLGNQRLVVDEGWWQSRTLLVAAAVGVFCLLALYLRRTRRTVHP